MTEDSSRIEHPASHAVPAHADINHSFFQLPTLQQVNTSHSTASLVSTQNLQHYRRIRPSALQRKQWIKVVHQPPRQTSRGEIAGRTQPAQRKKNTPEHFPEVSQGRLRAARQRVNSKKSLKLYRPATSGPCDLTALTKSQEALEGDFCRSSFHKGSVLW